MHTKEPWITYTDNEHMLEIIAQVNRHYPIPIAVIHQAQLDEYKANAARIVACVNGCAGIDPAAVPALIEACKAILTCAGDGSLSLASARKLAKAALTAAGVKP